MPAKLFSPRNLPPALQPQLSEKWVAQELNAKGLLSASKVSCLEDKRRSSGFLGSIAAVAVAGMTVVVMTKLGFAVNEALVAGALVAVFGLAAAAMQGVDNHGADKKFWLHNFGTAATGRLSADAMVVYNTHGIGMEANGIVIMYIFEDAKGVKHMGGEGLGKAYLPCQSALKGGTEVQILYHPDHPEMNTICLPLSMEEYCLRNDREWA
ncbi:MAG: hypothetical protein ACAH80_16290 [Alphaproteobacteria bacterium]